MRYLLIVVMAGMLGACARGDIIATPTPNEIIKVAYIENTQNQKATWLADNNNLSVRLTKRDHNGRVIFNKSIKSDPNSFNWLITNLEKANFTQIPSYNQTQGPNLVGQTERPYPANSKVVVITTLGQKYTYVQSSASRIPEDIAKIGEAMPNVFRID